MACNKIYLKLKRSLGIVGKLSLSLTTNISCLIKLAYS